MSVLKATTAEYQRKTGVTQRASDEAQKYLEADLQDIYEQANKLAQDGVGMKLLHNIITRGGIVV